MNIISSLKKILFTSLAIAATTFFTSCDSCDRKEDTETSTGTIEGEGTMTTSDTIDNDHAGKTTEDAGTGTSSGNTPGTSTRSGSTTGGGTTGSGSGSTGTGTTGTTNRNSVEAGTGGNSTGYGDSNSAIENSSTPSIKQGTPVRSSGSSGSGMGTGTGSTGNNSKVTRPEDQRN